MNYYSENDPRLTAWLYDLMAAGAIAPGYVDTRSVEDVLPDDLRGFTQCHFFAGIGAWAYALRLAGWPDDRPVWTGSCPCQPFSAAGEGRGFDDPRHLWPAWHWLIRQCRPRVVFGEQVASRDGLAWLDVVQADLEAAGYAVGPVDLCAAGVGAPHIRQRLWFVGHADGERLDPSPGGRLRLHAEHDAEPLRGLGHARGEGPPARECPELPRAQRNEEGRAVAEPGGAWADLEWLPCRDGKQRPTQPGIFPLAYGAPARVVRLRGYGNAIVPQAAAEVIKAYLSII